MKRTAYIAAAGCFVLLALGCASMAVEPTGSVLLPHDVAVVPPDPSLPAQAKDFSGRWSGTWDGILGHTLVVEQINPPDVKVIYAWGKAPAWQIYEPKWLRTGGKIESGILTISLPRPATVTYRMQPDGTLDAVYKWTGGTSRAIMTRVK